MVSLPSAAQVYSHRSCSWHSQQCTCAATMQSAPPGLLPGSLPGDFACQHQQCMFLSLSIAGIVRKRRTGRSMGTAASRMTPGRKAQQSDAGGAQQKRRRQRRSERCTAAHGWLARTPLHLYLWMHVQGEGLVCEPPGAALFAAVRVVAPSPAYSYCSMYFTRKVLLQLQRLSHNAMSIDCIRIHTVAWTTLPCPRQVQHCFCFLH